MRLCTHFLTVMLIALTCSDVWCLQFTSASDNLKIVIPEAEERNQSFAFEKTPDGTPALALCWDSGKWNWTEFVLIPPVHLPLFKKLQVSATVYLPEDSGLSSFNLRIVDGQGEVFQFPHPVDSGKTGWQRFLFTIDLENELVQSWGENQNNHLDFPLSIAGAGIDFQKNQGQRKIFVKDIDFAILEEPKASLLVADLGVEDQAVSINAGHARRQSAEVKSMPGGERGLRVNWEGSAASYVELSMEEAPELPDFGQAQIRVRAYIPADCQATYLNLRLRDGGGETFQFRAPITPGAEGWRDFYYNIDTAAPVAESWNGNNDQKVELPLYFEGFGVEFKPDGKSGWIGLSTVRFYISSGGGSASLDLQTGNPLHIQVPGEEGKLGLLLKLSSAAGEPAPLLLEYTLCDTEGKILASEKLEKRLTPEAPEWFVKLPSPKAYGVYTVDTVLSSPSGAKKKG